MMGGLAWECFYTSIFSIFSSHFEQPSITFIIKKKTTKHQVIFFHLRHFKPEAKIQSNDRGNEFKLSAIKVWKTVFQGLPSDL